MPRNPLIWTWMTLMAGASVAWCEDWPGWRGADRTGVSAEKGILEAWPEAGPELAWKATGMGTGYSTPAVAQGKIFLMGAKDGKEYVLAIEEKGGKLIWEKPLGNVAGVGYPGPRCTPTVDGEQLFALTSGGVLGCLNVADGSIQWTKDYRKDLGGEHGSWGFAESPLVDGDHLIVTPGGSNATMAALNKSDGSTVWKCAVSDGNTAGYASPIIAMVGKTKQYVNFTHGALIGVDAKTGKLAWRYAKSANGTANCSTAVAKGGFVFSASGYGTGGGLVKIAAKSAKEEYFSNRFQNHHGGFVLLGKHLYGTNERGLVCMDFRTGKVAWFDDCVGKGSITAVGNLLVVRSQDGPVALVEANPKSYKLLGRFRQPERSSEAAWPYPVVANGMLYLRDQDKLFAYSIKANP